MISAGYYVTLWKEAWAGSPGLSVADCLVYMAPDWWGLGWTSSEPNSDPLVEAAHFGLTPAQLPAFRSWASAAFDAGNLRYPAAFADVGTANECARRLSCPGVRVLGLSFPESAAATLLEMFRPVRQESSPPGAYECVAESKPAAEGGSLRGFEIVGYVPSGQFESHRCNALAADFRSRLGVGLNESGLVDAAGAAQRCADYANALEGHTCADLWLPGQIIEYHR